MAFCCKISFWKARVASYSCPYPQLVAGAHEWISAYPMNGCVTIYWNSEETCFFMASGSETLINRAQILSPRETPELPLTEYMALFTITEATQEDVGGRNAT